MSPQKLLVYLLYNIFLYYLHLRYFLFLSWYFGAKAVNDLRVIGPFLFCLVFLISNNTQRCRMLDLKRLNRIENGYLLAPIIAAAAISGAAALGGSIAGNLFNRNSTDKTNQTNKDIARENLEQQNKWRQEDFAYQDRVRNETWAREDRLIAAQQQREDTSYQRSVADAQAAGLSPLALSALDGSAGSVATNSGATTAPNTQNPASWTAQAHQMDVSGIISSVISSANLAEQYNWHNQNATHWDKQLALDYARLSEQSSEFNKQINVMQSEGQANRDSQESMKHMEMLQSAANLSATLENNVLLQANEHSFQANERDFNYIVQSQDKMIEANTSYCKALGLNYNLVPYTDVSEYRDALIVYRRNIADYNQDILDGKYSGDFNTSETKSFNKAVSANGAVGAGVGSVSGNLSAGGATSEGRTESATMPDVAKAATNKAHGGLVDVPILVRNASDIRAYIKRYK